MSNLINTQYHPEWADQTVEPGGHGAAVGNCDDTHYINKISRNIHFDWMKPSNKPVIVRHIEPGQHIRVKPREDVKHGNLRFLNLCKKMGLNPSTYK